MKDACVTHAGAHRRGRHASVAVDRDTVREEAMLQYAATFNVSTARDCRSEEEEQLHDHREGDHGQQDGAK